jgi:hypothetical protein
MNTNAGEKLFLSWFGVSHYYTQQVDHFYNISLSPITSEVFIPCKVFLRHQIFFNSGTLTSDMYNIAKPVLELHTSQVRHWPEDVSVQHKILSFNTNERTSYFFLSHLENAQLIIKSNVNPILSQLVIVQITEFSVCHSVQEKNVSINNNNKFIFIGRAILYNHRAMCEFNIITSDVSLHDTKNSSKKAVQN